MNPTSNKMDSNLTGMWVSFFTTAGIPSDVAATYALTFTENRIQNDMLLDLNKEYLKDMGITRMGDVIAILRHAKQVHESTARDRVLNTAAVNTKVPVAAVTGRATVTQSSSPASRILEHYTRNVPAQESPPPSTVQNKRKSIEIGPDTENNIKKARLIRFGAGPTSQVKEGIINKQTVFSRLGNTETVKPSPTATAQGKPIYARLGSKEQEEAKHIIPMQKDALKYEGILKSTTIAKKVVTVTTSKNNIRKIALGSVGGTMRADEAPVSVKDKLALPKPKSVKFSNHVEYKEIEIAKKLPIVKPKFTPVFNKPERRLSMPENTSISVKSRLGSVKNVNNLTITSNVFKRLGA